MSDAEHKYSSKTLFTVHNLLVTLTGLASITFGIFTWSATRAIDKLETVSKDVSTVVSVNAVQENRIGAIEGRLDKDEVRIFNHETRIVRIEARHADRLQ